MVQLPRGLDRDDVIVQLRERGVDSKPYLPAIHLNAFYRERFGHREGEFPVCEDVAARSLALPFFGSLSEGEIGQVAEALTAIVPERPDQRDEPGQAAAARPGGHLLEPRPAVERPRRRVVEPGVDADRAQPDRAGPQRGRLQQRQRRAAAPVLGIGGQRVDVEATVRRGWCGPRARVVETQGGRPAPRRERAQWW